MSHPWRLAKKPFLGGWVKYFGGLSRAVTVDSSMYDKRDQGGYLSAQCKLSYEATVSSGHAEVVAQPFPILSVLQQTIR